MKRQKIVQTIVWCFKVEENFHTKRVTKKLFVTMTINITRKEHTKNHKKNYKGLNKS